MEHVAHYQIRNRGTVGGSIAHADPAAEMPGIAVTCDAEIAVTGSTGSRVIRADDFFLGALTTALEHDEIITEIRLPAWPAKRRWGFREFARRRGDFAMAAAALFYDQDASGKAVNAHVGVIGLGDRPRRLPEVEAVINGRMIDEATIERAAEVTSATVDAQEDIHASAAYRRSLAGTMVERALRSAAAIVQSGDHAHQLRSQRQADQRQCRGAHHAGRLPAPSSAAHRHPCRLRARRLRRLHRDRRRICRPRPA